MMDLLLGHIGGLPGQGVEIQVAEHNALGGACGAAGEKDHCLRAVILLGNISSRHTAAKPDESLPVDVFVNEFGELSFRKEFLADIEGERKFIGHMAHDDLFQRALPGSARLLAASMT